MCLRLPANTFSFYLHTIYFSVYSLCKQFKSKFCKPPPPPDVLLLDLVEVPFCVFAVVVVVVVVFSIFWSPIFKSNRVSGGLND